MKSQQEKDYDRDLSWSENLDDIEINGEEQSEISKKTVFAGLIKAFAMAVIALALLVFVGIAWFTMNENIGTNGMSVTAAANPFELKSTGAAGLYDGFLQEITSEYADAQTTEGHQGIKWQLVSGESELNNLYTESGDPDLEEITRLDSDRYGLKPGDYGSLKFTIVPKRNDEMEILNSVKVTGYEATYDAENYKTDAPMTVVEDAGINNFRSAHILFFYMGTDNHKHLLTEEGFTETVNNGTEKEVTLYWAWPATLQEILDADIDGLDDAVASNEVKRFFFEHPEYYLKPIGEASFEDFTVDCLEDKAAEDAAIAEVISLVSGRNYNQYGSMYNDADQAIGDHTNYILVELFASLKPDEE